MATRKSKTETWKGKFFHRVTKMESVPIPDVEGHVFGSAMREGVVIYENGVCGWQKVIANFDYVNGVGSAFSYTMVTYEDGSTTTVYYTSTGTGPTIGKFIHGTGRFKGIKGTVTAIGKQIPPEKGEILGKVFGEMTIEFTLPSK
jgi:hypothetical protein